MAWVIRKKGTAQWLRTRDAGDPMRGYWVDDADRATLLSAAEVRRLAPYGRTLFDGARVHAESWNQTPPGLM